MAIQFDSYIFLTLIQLHDKPYVFFKARQSTCNSLWYSMNHGHIHSLFNCVCLFNWSSWKLLVDISAKLTTHCFSWDATKRPKHAIVPDEFQWNHTSNRFGHAKSSTNPTSSSFKRRQWPGRTSRRWYHWHRMCHISWFTHQVHRPECACQHGSASLHPIPTLYLQILHMRNQPGLCLEHIWQGFRSFRLSQMSTSGGSGGFTSNGEVNQVIILVAPPLRGWLTSFMKQFSIAFYTRSCGCWSLIKVLQLLINY